MDVWDRTTCPARLAKENTVSDTAATGSPTR